MDMIKCRMVNIFQFHFSSSIDITGFLCNLKVKRMKIQGISPNQLNKGYVEYLSIFMQQVAFQGGIQICLFLACSFRFCFPCQIKFEGSASS